MEVLTTPKSVIGGSLGMDRKDSTARDVSAPMTSKLVTRFGQYVG